MELEEARQLLRWAVSRSSARRVAVAHGIKPKNLSNFLSGQVAKPSGDVLNQLFRAATALRSSPEFAQEQPLARADMRKDAQQPLHAPSYWQGEMTATLRALLAIREMTEAATTSVRGLVESGVLLQGGPPPAASPKPGAAGTGARDMTAEEFVAEMERRGYSPPKSPPHPLPAAG